MRGEEREFTIITQSQQFEVDNYLNLYHVQSGLYLMFHKTPFPDVCFYFAKEYTQLPTKDYYKIYLSKRLNVINFRFDKATYKSLDNRTQFLNNINELVPEDYNKVYELYNNFRKFQSFEQGLEDVLTLDSEKDVLDPKNRIIEGLQLKLNEIVIRCDKAESIVSEVVEKYKEKSTELQAIERERNLLEMNAREQEDKFHTDIMALKNECKEKIKEHSERENRDYMDLYKRLIEAEAFGSKVESLGMSMSSLQKSLERESLENKRTKDINMNLVKQIQGEKERIKQITSNNEMLVIQMNKHQMLSDEHEINMGKLMKEIDAKSDECKMLSNNLEKVGTRSSNALENALTDRVHDLESKNANLMQENKEINIEKNRIEGQFNKVKMTLSGLGL